jgi:hypothetical protein
MKTLFTILAFAFLNLTAQAGQELDKFKQDVDALFAAQKANSNQIITYSDEKGYLVKAVLDPERYGRMIAESPYGNIDTQQHKETFENFGLTVNYFLNSFKKQHGKYDKEYLDSFEILFRIAVAGANIVKKVTLDNNKTEESRAFAESVIKSATAAPQLMISALEKDIADGKFSMLFTPIAQKRLDQLQDFASK